MKIDNAIFLAAGYGNRLKPVTNTIPKPLVEVLGMPLIEREIKAVLPHIRNNIYIVTGYLGEQFEYLKDQFPNVQIIENPHYETMNNISSVYVAGNVLENGSCMICESDIFVADANVFNEMPESSFYFGEYFEGYLDDWVFDVTEGRISRVGIGGENTYKMVGFSYFTKKDAGILTEEIKRQIEVYQNYNCLWDEVSDLLLPKIPMVIHEIGKGSLIEIDSYEELKVIDSKYL